MGTTSSKSLSPQHTHIRDSVVIYDGVPRLHRPMYAGSPDGRYIFVIGSFHITSVNEDVFSFDLDIIDHFLSERTRIYSIGDFYNLGLPAGFYALDEQNLVIIDYNPDEQTLRQRLITIDLRKKTASCNFYRNYSANLIMFHLPKTSIGEEWAVTVVPNRHSRNYRLPSAVNLPTLLLYPQTGVVYPLNPLSNKSQREITGLIAQAQSRVLETYKSRFYCPQVSTLYAPFFITNTSLGFFLDEGKFDEIIDPTTILVMDLATGTVCMKEVACSSAFNKPSNARWSQASNDQMALITSYGRGWLWQKLSASVLLIGLLLSFTVPLCGALLLYPFVGSSTWFQRCHELAMMKLREMFDIRYRFLQSKASSRIGVLCTRTLKWTEIKADLRNDEEPRIISLKGGQFVISSMTFNMKSGRVLGHWLLGEEKHDYENRGSNQGRMERIQLIGSPLRMSSLTNLSLIATQKIHRIPREILDQIVVRML